jgi:hypothetical protein
MCKVPRSLYFGHTPPARQGQLRSAKLDHSGGTPVIVCASQRRWLKDDQRAVFQPVVVALFVMTLIWFGGSGTVTVETLRLFWIGLPAAVIGTWPGLKLYGRMDEATIRIVVLVLLCVSVAHPAAMGVDQG